MRRLPPGGLAVSVGLHAFLAAALLLALRVPVERVLFVDLTRWSPSRPGPAGPEAGAAVARAQPRRSAERLGARSPAVASAWPVPSAASGSPPSAPPPRASPRAAPENLAAPPVPPSPPVASPPRAAGAPATLGQGVTFDGSVGSHGGAKPEDAGGAAPAAVAPSGPGSGLARTGSPGGGAGGGSGEDAAGGGAGPAGGALALATRGEAAGAREADYAAYLAALRERIQEAVRYPTAARRQGLAGTVVLEIEVEASGAIARVALVASSTHAALDDAALEAVRGVTPVPFPSGLRPRALRVRLPVVFELR